MTGPPQTPERQADSREEYEALLNNVDVEDDSMSSNNASLRSTKTSPRNTLADSFIQGQIDGSDVEATLEVRRPFAPDQFAEGYETSKWEIFAYYSYYVGNTGLTLAIFAPMAMQNLVSQAAGEDGVLRFLGRYLQIVTLLMASRG